LYEHVYILGGLVVHILAVGLKVAGSKPAEDDEVLRVIKICSMRFIRRGIKAVCLMS
jgi:hypothetical protein